MAKKFIRMAAERVHERLRLGRLELHDAVHVPGDLTISDPAVAYLCNTLRVEGDLNLSGCTNLEALPEQLIVKGALIIDGCIHIKRLPSGMREVNDFSAMGCTALETLEPIGAFRGRVNLVGCAGLEPLAPDFSGTALVRINSCWIYPEAFYLEKVLPETIISAAPGRRLGELIEHRLLSRHPIQDAIITCAKYEYGTAGDLRLGMDATSLVVEEPN